MDSLLANYASSDEEEETQPPKRTALPSAPTNDDDPSFSKSSSSSSLFSSLPKPKPSSSLFQTLPQPKQQPSKTPSSLDQEDHSKPATKSSATLPKTPSGFSSLPPPKPTSSLSSSDPKPKRVVQFKPPTNPFSVKSTEIDDEDEDEELEKERKRRRDSELASGTSSVKSFLSSIPVPKNSVTLGALPTSGSGRRAVVETELSASNSGASSGGNDGNSASYDQNAENYGHYYGYGSYESNPDQNAGNYGSYENYNPGYDQTGLGVGSGDGSGYGSYGDYGQYGNNWVEGSAVAAVPEDSGVSQTGFKVSGKRGRNEVPTEIIEVNQDELMKNRPREDQVKLTGIAFGPSYQPVSTKGKPTKLHKRKHQISSLYFDMKQKEMELSERRSRGLLTKAETQAKYGW